MPDTSDLRIERLAAELDSLGYRAQKRECRIDSSTMGFEMQIYYSSQGTIKISTAFEGDGLIFELGSLNVFNMNAQFSRAFRDDNGAMVLDSDFLYPSEHEPSQSQLKRMLVEHEASIDVLRKELLRPKPAAQSRSGSGRSYQVATEEEIRMAHGPI